MQRSLLLTLSLGALSMAASGATTFDFTSSSTGTFAGSGCTVTAGASGANCALGNTFSLTVDAITMTATAVSSANGTTDDYIAARLYKSPGSAPYVGFGVCTAAEGIPTGTCSLTEGYIDNNGADEFVLFTFSTPVDITSLTIWGTNAGDSDMRWWFAPLAADPNGQGAVAGALDVDGNGNIINFAGTVLTQHLLIGLQLLDGNDTDGVKIQSLSVTAPNTVPEPGSMALLGSGLLGLGFIARRRTARK